MTKAMPKEMLPIIDKPIIQYVVEEAVAGGVTDIIIVGSSNKRAIEDHFDHQYELENKLRADGKGAIADELNRVAELANFIYLRQKGSYGTATPILNASHLLHEEPFLVLFGDDFFNAPTPRSVQLIEAFDRYQQPVVSLVPMDPHKASSYGVVVIKRDLGDGVFELSGIVEKPSLDETPVHDGVAYVSVAGYVLTPEVLGYMDGLAPHRNGELVAADAINKYVKAGGVLYGRVIEGQWHDAGNKQKYLEAIVDVALADPEISADFEQYLRAKLS
jgi:UTP--glucose-1-phosphate uridylyltransferase